MKKVLFTTTVTSTMNAFLLPYLKWFQEQGFEVHGAACGAKDIPHCDKVYDLPFARSPFAARNVSGYKKLKQLLQENHYDLIHCHTPVAGVFTRLAARKARKAGTKVIYTAHGFHFYKGAPKKNWMLFYPVEKWLSRYTDCLITINEEDHKTAVSKGFLSKEIVKVDGVGVDLKKFYPVSDIEKEQLRAEKGFCKDAFLLFFAAEINGRKNQSFLLPVAKELKDKVPGLKIVLAGDGPLKGQLESQIIDAGLQDTIILLGYRRDIKELVQLSDIIISTSRQEGLPVNIMEGLACGKPVVASDIRGHRDLIENDVNGYLFNISDTKGISDRIIKLCRDKQKYAQLSVNASAGVHPYSLENTLSDYEGIYRRLMGE